MSSVKAYPRKLIGKFPVQLEYLEISLDNVVAGVTNDNYRIWLEDLMDLGFFSDPKILSDVPKYDINSKYYQ